MHIQLIKIIKCIQFATFYSKFNSNEKNHILLESIINWFNFNYIYLSYIFCFDFSGFRFNGIITFV